MPKVTAHLSMSLFEGLRDLRLQPVEVHASPNATHVIYRKTRVRAQSW